MSKQSKSKATLALGKSIVKLLKKEKVFDARKIKVLPRKIIIAFSIDPDTKERLEWVIGEVATFEDMRHFRSNSHFAEFAMLKELERLELIIKDRKGVTRK